jgi:hypothetical protein
MQKLTALSLASAAIATGAILLAPGQAHAACQHSNNICATFDTNLAATPTLGNPGGFNFSGTLGTPGSPITHYRVGLRITGFTGTFPLSIDSSLISISGDGITGTVSPFSGSILVPGNSPGISSGPARWTSFANLSTNLLSGNFANSKLNFTIPSGLNAGTSISAFIQYSNGTANPGDTDDLANSSRFISTSTPPVPAPLPLLGAGAAFGYARHMRRRIAHSA